MMGRGNWKFFLGLSGGLLLLILLPLTFKISSYSLHIFIMVLYFSYLSSAWNLLGGFAGQHSIGHSAFVGLGAYTSTFLFLQIGLNPWIGMVLGAILASLAGLFIGFLSFHYRLRGLYLSWSPSPLPKSWPSSSPTSAFSAGRAVWWSP